MRDARLVRTGLRILLRTLLGVLAVVVLAVVTLTVLWLFRREDPISFLPDQYVAYVQVPSIRAVYDQWLNLEAADAVLGRPELAPYRRIVTDLRGLTLTSSPLVRTLLEVPADVMLLKDGTFVAAVDLGWRGIFTPLVRIVAPRLKVKKFAFLIDDGMPLYRYVSGKTTISFTLVNNVALVSLDAAALKEALVRRAGRAGLDVKVSPEVLDRMKSRSRSAIRVIADTSALTRQAFSASRIGAKVLTDIQMPEKSVLDVELTGDTLKLGVRLPITVTLRELATVLGSSPAPMGVLREVPANASLLSVLNVAPLGSLYRLAAAFQGKDVQDVFAKADSGARSLVGMGLDELLFSWVGAEVGAFTLSGSAQTVFFARISNETAYHKAIEKLTSSAVAGKDASLVLDGVRVDRITLPWYVDGILDLVGVDVPEPYYITRDGYFFLSLDAGNLSAVVTALQKGDTLGRADRYTAVAGAMRANASMFTWYDAEHATPFFMQGTGALVDVLRLYASGAVSVHASASEIRLDLVARRGTSAGVQLMHGFPIVPKGALSGDMVAFRFKVPENPGSDSPGPSSPVSSSPASDSPGSGSASLAWIADRSTLVLADAGGQQIATVKLDRDSVLLPEVGADGLVADLWAVSPGGTVYRFGPKLVPQAPFPIATGITGSMPPGLLGGRLALFSRLDSSLQLIGSDGTRSTALSRVDGSLFVLPDERNGMLAYSPKGFGAKVHLADAAGKEAPGWPVQASGISFGTPRILARAGSLVVTFLTQAGTLHAWDAAGVTLPGFPVSLPGVYYATPQPMLVDGQPALVTLAEDGSMSMVAMDGTVLRRARVPNLNGRNARALVARLNGDATEQLLLYGSGGFIAGYDAAFRPLPGFPIKGVSRPQLVDIDQDGRLDLVTAGLDGKVYAYSLGRNKQ